MFNAARFKSSRVSSVEGDFDTGTDSPVNILSLTMQSPESSKLSQGNWVGNFVHISGYEIARVDVAPEATAKDSDVAIKARDLAQTLHRCLGFDEGGGDADHRDEEDASSIVVVFVDGPKEQTSNLEDVERMEGFIHEELASSLLLDSCQRCVRGSLAHHCRYQP